MMLHDILYHIPDSDITDSHVITYRHNICNIIYYISRLDRKLSNTYVVLEPTSEHLQNKHTMVLGPNTYYTLMTVGFVVGKTEGTPNCVQRKPKKTNENNVWGAKTYGKHKLLQPKP